MRIETKLKNMGYIYFDYSMNERIFCKEYNSYFCQIIVKNKKLSNYFVVPYKVHSYSDLGNIKIALDNLFKDVEEVKDYF